MMDRKDTVGLLIAGIVLVGQSFTTLAPAGPWNSPSFSRGVFGLLGLCLLYIAWFKRTFGFYGVAPTVDRWRSWNLLASCCGVWIGVLGRHRIIRVVDGNGFFPEPAGLLLALVGVLALMNSAHVWLITSGPLTDEEE